MAVVVEGEEGDGSVDWDHKKDANNVFLLVWFQVPGGMHEYQEEGDEEGDGGEDCCDTKTEFVKGVAVPYGLLCDCQVLLGGIAFWPAHLGQNSGSGR